ncbi:MAG: acyl-ACP desaturase, partial [Chitinophagaceae bacterium]
MSFFADKRREVMMHIEKYMLESMGTYLKPIDTNWQPSDFLPDSTSETFYQDIRILRDNAKDLSYDLVAVLIGDTLLSRMCGVIASDEARHAKAYKDFMNRIFEVDPNEAMLAFEDMMRKKIVMPAHFLREVGLKIGQTFGHFTDAAQRLG